MDPIVEIELHRLEAEALRRKTAARERVKKSLEAKPFIDFRQVRLNLPEKPTTGYSLRQWDDIEGQIVQIFVDNKTLVLPTCRLDNYLGMLTIIHPELFEIGFHGYVSKQFELHQFV